MRVLLVDDNPECLEACAAELESAGHEPVAFDTFSDMIAGLSDTSVDVAVLDLEVPGESAFEAMQWLRSRRAGLPIVALTSHAADDYLFAALRSGAVGYVLKHDGPGALSRAVQEAADGGAPMTPRIARRVLEAFREPRRAPGSVDLEAEEWPPPTRRELDVLHALSRGLTYQECSGVLGIGVDTVRTHVRNVYRKLHAASKAEANPRCSPAIGSFAAVAVKPCRGASARTPASTHGTSSGPTETPSLATWPTPVMPAGRSFERPTCRPSPAASHTTLRRSRSWRRSRAPPTSTWAAAVPRRGTRMCGAATRCWRSGS